MLLYGPPFIHYYHKEYVLSWSELEVWGFPLFYFLEKNCISNGTVAVPVKQLHKFFWCMIVTCEYFRLMRLVNLKCFFYLELSILISILSHRCVFGVLMEHVTGFVGVYIQLAWRLSVAEEMLLISTTPRTTEFLAIVSLQDLATNEFEAMEQDHGDHFDHVTPFQELAMYPRMGESSRKCLSGLSSL